MTSSLCRKYREDGYCIPEGYTFDEVKLSGLQKVLAEIVAEHGPEASDGMDNPHLRDARLLEFTLAGEVLDLVEPLVGPDIVFGSTQLFAKAVKVGKATPWHTDNSYLRMVLDDLDTVVNVWVSVDGSAPDNGCVRVIPGSHRERQWERPDADDHKVTVDEANAVDLVLAPGQVSLHDGGIVHGASPNTSGRPRTGIAMRYFSARVTVDTQRMKDYPLWLARGVSHGKNEYVHPRPQPLAQSRFS
jgi:phytanoyl-CoA dioxygenase PhyH